MDHFIEVCRGCGAVIRQCQCPSPAKEQRLGLCRQCSQEEADRLAAELLRGKEMGFTAAPGRVRYSTMLARLREQGEEAAEAVEVVEELYRKCGNHCVHHGKLEDPVIGTAGEGVIVFACPWCSGPAVLRAWEAEAEK